MCFSSTASFIAGGSLAIIGAVSLTKPKNKSQFMFAAIPLLFGIQQISEGFLWLALQHSAFSSWRTEMTYVFLFFAQALWTTWIPVSFYVMETNKSRKNYLIPVCFFGIGATLTLGYRLLFYPVTVEIMQHHIYYGIESPQWITVFSSICYVVSILFPAFISSIKGTTFLGILLVVSLLVTKLFFDAYLISVWCFFAASLSVAVIYILKELNQPAKLGLMLKRGDLLSGFGKSRDGLPSH